jgi:cell division protein FtsB
MNRIDPSPTKAQKAELRARLVMSVGTILLIYIIVSTCQALWQNYRLNQDLAQLKAKNAELKLTNNYLQNLIAYRKTDAFKDKEARSKLNYQKPGETVLIIPEDDVQRFVEGNAKARPKDEQPRPLTNPEKWWQYIKG